MRSQPYRLHHVHQSETQYQFSGRKKSKTSKSPTLLKRDTSSGTLDAGYFKSGDLWRRIPWHWLLLTSHTLTLVTFHAAYFDIRYFWYRIPWELLLLTQTALTSGTSDTYYFDTGWFETGNLDNIKCLEGQEHVLNRVPGCCITRRQICWRKGVLSQWVVFGRQILTA